MTHCDPMNFSMPGFPVLQISRSLLSFMPIELETLSSHLILCQPLLLLLSIFPSIRVFSSESALRIRWPKYWSFSFSINHSKEYSGLISFRIDWFDFLSVFSSTTIQSTNSLVLRLLYGLTLTSLHGYWKNHTFDYMDLCWQSDVSAF